jgi:hypothetical protein
MQLVPVMVLMVAGVTGNGDGSDLEWATHYGQARKSAQQDQRPLLIVLEDPEKPAAKFDDLKLASKAGQKQLLENYKLCRVDVSTPYGKKVKEAFRANELPYTAITDKSAQFITFRGGGDMQPNDWTAALSKHKEGQIVGQVRVSNKQQAVRSNEQPTYQQFNFQSFSSGST